MISNYVEQLTSLWLLWMENHNISNDPSKSFEDRKLAGLECEKIQKKRQQIILDIDKLFDE